LLSLVGRYQTQLLPEMMVPAGERELNVLVFALCGTTSSMPIDPVVAFLIDVFGGRNNDIVSETWI
jgi:hypothetical protein